MKEQEEKRAAVHGAKTVDRAARRAKRATVIEMTIEEEAEEGQEEEEGCVGMKGRVFPRQKRHIAVVLDDDSDAEEGGLGFRV